MKITKAFIFVEIDDNKKLRQVLLNKEQQKLLIDIIDSGVVTGRTVKISENPIESIEVST